MIKAAYKIPMISKEKRQTISYGISIEITRKFDKSDNSIKNPRIFKLAHYILLTSKQSSNTCLTDSKF